MSKLAFSVVSLVQGISVYHIVQSIALMLYCPEWYGTTTLVCRTDLNPVNKSRWVQLETMGLPASLIVIGVLTCPADWLTSISLRKHWSSYILYGRMWHWWLSSFRRTFAGITVIVAVTILVGHSSRTFTVPPESYALLNNNILARPVNFIHSNYYIRVFIFTTAACQHPSKAILSPQPRAALLNSIFALLLLLRLLLLLYIYIYIYYDRIFGQTCTRGQNSWEVKGEVADRRKMRSSSTLHRQNERIVRLLLL